MIRRRKSVRPGEIQGIEFHARIGQTARQGQPLGNEVHVFLKANKRINVRSALTAIASGGDPAVERRQLVFCIKGIGVTAIRI